MYAHVTDGIVDNVLGSPPRYEFQDGRWWDLRPRDLATLATVGWYPVQEVAKPADTALTTWEPVFTFNAGTVTQSWIEVAKSQDQLDAELEASNETTIKDRARTALGRNATYLALDPPTNTQNVAQVKSLTQQVNGLIKIMLRDLSNTVGTNGP